MNGELMSKAVGGDKDAFAEIFTEIADEIYRVAYIYVKNPDDAKDIVQETAYRCFKSVKKLRNPEYFKTWAVKTAMNCALNFIRSARRTQPLEEAVLSDTAGSPENAAIASATLDRLLNNLDEREKTVILMKYLYDMPFNEIAKELKIPVGTAKTVLYRAVDKIKKENS